MKVRLTEIEEALRNPRAFARNREASRSAFKSRYLTLRTVALSFHKINDLNASEALLEQRLRKTFKTTKDNEDYLERLRQYASAYESLGTTVAKVRSNIRVPLPEEYADFQITGQVARLDVDPTGGYRAWILTNKTENWRDELRFPLLQIACANQLAVDVEEVVPGVYDFSTGSYTDLRYSRKDIQSARLKSIKLLDELNRYRSSK